MTTNKQNDSNKKLSIQVSLNGLSFCILNLDSKEICYLKRFDLQKQLDPIKLLDRIESIYEQDDELQQPVREVCLLFNNALFSLVPEELFDEENAASFLKFNTRILKTDFIAFDNISQGIVNVYIPYANIINYFFDRYGEFEYRHSLSVLIDSFLALPAESPEPKVYLHAQQKSYDLIVIENGKLIFANSFEYETKEDFLYYILFTAEQLNLDPEKIDLVLLGGIRKDSEEYNMCWDYIKNISFLGPFHPFTFEENAQPQEELSEYLLIKSL